MSKLRTRFSVKRKTLQVAAPAVLLCCLYFGVISTQINAEKGMVKKESPVPSPGAIGTMADEMPEKAEQVFAESQESLVEENTAEADPAIMPPKAKQKMGAYSTYSNMAMSFRADKAFLSWENSYQRNIASFEIERSEDDQQFESLGKIAGLGKGEHFKDKQYEFLDESLAFVEMPRVYYRIKERGTNDEVNYSEVLEYDLGLDMGVYASFREYSENTLDFMLAADSRASFEFEIVDVSGVPLSSGEIQLDFEARNYKISQPSLKKGHYFLFLSNQEHEFRKQFEIK